MDLPYFSFDPEIELIQTWKQTMTTGTIIAVAAVASQFGAAPAIAQTATDKDQNARHYSDGPKAEAPHIMKDLKSAPNNTTSQATDTNHHYRGGSKTEAPHHMSDKRQ